MKTTLRVLLVLIVSALPAWAVLGEYEGSVGLDQQVLHGELREETHAGYKVHQIVTSDGTMVREFVSPDGRVFAIAWRAHAFPNLQQLLGSYFPRVQQAAQAKVQRSPWLSIQSPDFVYFCGGHMMNFHGIAYLPALFPKNLSLEVVR